MIQLDYRDARPLYEQVTDKMERLIIRGVLAPDEKLPSVRSLAVELSINPNTVQRAYTELELRGFLYSVQGRGHFVAYREDLLDMKRLEYIEKIESIIREAEDVGIDRGSIIGALAAAGAGDSPTTASPGQAAPSGTAAGKGGDI